MAQEKKSYMADMQVEIIPDESGDKVKALRIHGFHNEHMPILLWCDFLQRLGLITPGEDVMFVNGR